MIGTPADSTDPPDRREWKLDALSDVLSVLRLTGGVFLDAEFSEPWSVYSRVSPGDIGTQATVPDHMVAYHYVVSGSMLVELPGQAPVPVEAGSVVLLPRNDPHVLTSAAGLMPVDPEHLVEPDAEGGLARLRYGGGGPATHIVCGFAGVEARDHPLLASLPRTLVLNLDGKPAHAWIATSFRYAAGQISAVSAGSSIALTKLSELMFVEAVRHYLDELPEERRGWLAGLRDPVIGRALALVHAQLGRAWTAESLADAVHLSRSAFAERFSLLIGMPPMAYLAQWRMQVAAQRLRDSRQGIAQVALEVGYASEAAFARAFKRALGCTPAVWRRSPRAAAAG